MCDKKLNKKYVGKNFDDFRRRLWRLGRRLWRLGLVNNPTYIFLFFIFMMTRY
jgi:hypothetical protein